MGQEIQRWGDAQQYRAEPMPFDVKEGPRVTLLNATPDPLGAIAAMCSIYEGKVVRDLSSVTDEERRHYWAELKKTHLKAPLEAVQLHFLIEGVTRSFTHQMVRQRTACYAQESLRFAVKENMADEVALPPSLIGTMSYSEWDEPSKSTHKQKQRYTWDDAVSVINTAYRELVDSGMPAEEARGLLPHSITTRLHYITNLRNLLEHVGNRLCTQAQFEWRLVVAAMASAIREYGYATSMPSMEWQCEEIAAEFKPICYMTGKCEFKAKFDRECSIRDRVDEFEKAGVPSSEWGREFVHSEGSLESARTLHPIQTWEWLADPGAARR